MPLNYKCGSLATVYAVVRVLQLAIIKVSAAGLTFHYCMALILDFAGAPNMVICSTRFQHRKIHQATWLSPDRNTTNQIDYVVIDGRHVSSVLDVRTLRGPNIDSDQKPQVNKHKECSTSRSCNHNRQLLMYAATETIGSAVPAGEAEEEEDLYSIGRTKWKRSEKKKRLSRDC